MQMNNVRMTAIFAGMMFVLSGCYSPSSKAWQDDTERYMNALCEQCIGHHKSEVIQKWGPPSSVSSDGKSGEVLIYDFSFTSQTEGTAYINPFANTITFNSPQTETVEKYKQLFCDSQGTIYSWRWKVASQTGRRSTPYQASGDTTATPAGSSAAPDKPQSIEERLKELKSLRDKGLISEEAYKNKERDILDRL